MKSYDVAILGTGISGTLLGAILARHKFRVLMIDSETHPRFAVGESTVGRTSSMMAVLADRYDVPEIRHVATFKEVTRSVTSACGIKRAVSFLYHRPGEQRAEECNQFVIPPLFHGPEMHLFRQDVDAYMLAACARYGATVRQQTRIKGIELDGSGVKLEDDRGQRYTARYFVDCSGYRSPLAQQLKLRETPPRVKHQSRSLFTHMVNVAPYDDLVEPAGRHGMPVPWFQSTLHHVFPGGWVWVIPFNNHRRATNPLCSVGITVDPRRFPRPPGSPDEDLRALIAPYPSLEKQLLGGNVVRPWVSTDRIQYSASRAMGPRYCLMAHSYGFIDPLFSRGLAATTDVVNALAARLMKALEDDDFSEQRFEYVERLSRGLLDYTDQLVNCAYIGFGHYPLLNAWLRVWALGEAGLDFLRLLKAQLRFRESRDPSVFEVLDDVPHPGMICPNHEGYRELFSAAVAQTEAVAEGKADPGQVASEIFRRLKEANLIAPNIRLHDPDSRLVPGDVWTSARALLWGRFFGPLDLRRRFYDLAAVPLIKHGWKNTSELGNPYS